MMALGIYGAGGLGREVRGLAETVNATSKRWGKIFFIVDNAEQKDVQGTEVFSLPEARSLFPELEALVAVGEPAAREALYNKLSEEKVSLATIIHPSAYIDGSAKIGIGAVICEYAVISSCVEISENVYVHPHTIIGHDTVVGKHSMIGGNSVVSGNCSIGERVYMGFLSGLKEEVKIGDDVICSAGAIVFRDIEDEMIVVGNPGRVAKRNEKKRVFS